MSRQFQCHSQYRSRASSSSSSRQVAVRTYHHCRRTPHCSKHTRSCEDSSQTFLDDAPTSAPKTLPRFWRLIELGFPSSRTGSHGMVAWHLQDTSAFSRCDLG
eukprot:5232853-Amphidinium_carterae.1